MGDFTSVGRNIKYTDEASWTKDLQDNGIQTGIEEI